MMTMMMMIMTVDGVRALNWILAEVGWLVKGLNCDLLPWDGRPECRVVHWEPVQNKGRRTVQYWNLCKRWDGIQCENHIALCFSALWLQKMNIVPFQLTLRLHVFSLRFFCRTTVVRFISKCAKNTESRVSVLWLTGQQGPQQLKGGRLKFACRLTRPRARKGFAILMLFLYRNSECNTLRLVRLKW